MAFVLAGDFLSNPGFFQAANTAKLPSTPTDHSS